MATQVQFRRGTTSQNNAFTGAQGEFTVDTEQWTIRIHDGTTPGGRQVPTLTATQTFTNKTISTNSVWNGNVIGLGYGGTGAALTGVAGAIAYSTGSALALSLAGTSGQVLTSGGTSGPTWVNASALSTGTATTATTATNIAGGSAGYLVYQQDTDTTSFIAPGTTGYILKSTGASTAPTWVTPDFTLGTTSVAVGTTETNFDGINTFYITGTTDATSTTTGVFRVAGGASIQKKLYVGSDLTVSGNLTVNGTTTNINTTNLVVEDKNVILGDVATPTDTTADGGGITLKGATDKTLNWVDATDSWTSSEHLDLASTKTYKIATTKVLEATKLFGDGQTSVTIADSGTTIDIGSASGTTTVKNNLTVDGDVQVKGGDITTNQTTFNLLNTTATTLNIGGAATTIGIGASTGTLTVNNAQTVFNSTKSIQVPVGTTLQRPTAVTGQIRYNTDLSTFEGYAASAWGSLGGVTSVDKLTYIIAETSAGASNGELEFYAEDATGLAATKVLGLNYSRMLELTGTVVGSQTTQNLFNTTATTVNAFGASTATTIGATTGTHTIRNATVSLPNATAITTGQTTVALLNTTATTINAFGAATAITLGNATSATLTLNPGTLVGTNTTQNVFNTTATTVNAFGAATTLTLGATSGTATIRNSTVAITNAATVGSTLGVTGDLTVNTNKFSVTAASGNTSVAGTLGVTGVVSANNTTQATDTTTGGLVTAGGLGVAKNAYVGGDLVISGNFTVNGTTTTISSTSLELTDPLIYLAQGNASNSVDIGFVGHFTSGTYQHTGFVRDATDSKWKLFSGVSTEPSTTIDFTTWTKDTIQVGAADVTSVILNGSTSGTTTLQASATAGSTTLTLPAATDTLVGKATTDTLTNKSISFGSNTITMTSAQLATALSDETGSGAAVFGTSPTFTTSFLVAGSSSGTTTVQATAAASGTLTLPAATDTLVGKATTDTLTNKTISGSSNTLSNIANSSLTNSSVTFGTTAVSLGSSSTSIAGLTSVTFAGSTSGTTQVLSTAIAGTSVLTLPAATDTLVGKATTDTLTNKTISGSSNTLSNIANSSLTNSSITVNGSSISLGGSATITATATNALTIGTGLSGTSYNGSSAVTINLANTAVTAGSYTYASITVDAQGRLTAASNGSTPLISGANISVGTISSGNLTVTGTITATGSISSYYSDDRLKTRTGNIENALEKVLSLDGFHYHANETAVALGYDASKQEVGLSAQQVQAVLPEVIAPAPIDPQYMTMHYERLVPLLVEAIKEQQKQIEELKAKLGN